MFRMCMCTGVKIVLTAGRRNEGGGEVIPGADPLMCEYVYVWLYMMNIPTA